MSKNVKKQVLGELEQLRVKNIADNQEMLAKLMNDLKCLPQFASIAKGGAKPKRQTKAKKRMSSEDSVYVRRNPPRIASLRSPPTTRARSRLNSTGSSNNSGTSTPIKSPDRLFVKFGGLFGGKRKAEDGDDDDIALYDEEEESYASELTWPSKKRVRRVTREPKEMKSVDDVTQEDLDMVANCVRDKQYDSLHGNTCHQCRQKTDDQKTVCRSGDCYGVRGQFCGPCLRNRYGEDAREALLNKDWICPPCRGICNCSFCRKAAGNSCTGILIHVARTQGFENVNDYLQSLRA